MFRDDPLTAHLGTCAGAEMGHYESEQTLSAAGLHLAFGMIRRARPSKHGKASRGHLILFCCCSQAASEHFMPAASTHRPAWRSWTDNAED